MTQANSRKRTCDDDDPDVVDRDTSRLLKRSKTGRGSDCSSVPSVLRVYPPGGARWSASATVGIRTRLSSPPAGRQSTAPVSKVQSDPLGGQASSSAPTVASGSTLSGYGSDVTRRLSFESTRSGAHCSSTPPAEVNDVTSLDEDDLTGSPDEDDNIRSTVEEYSDTASEEEYRATASSPHESQSSERTLTQTPPSSPAEDTDDWRAASWPIFVTPLHHHENPRGYAFRSVDVGSACGCNERCSALTCANALKNRCCVEANCSFKGGCGNALQDNPNLLLSMRRSSGEFGVTTVGMIPSGEVLGQYCGYITELGDLERRAAVDNGYRMLLETPSVDGKSIGIDALWCGTKMRFVNHHCDPNCRFQEVRVDQELTVVAVSLRDIMPGEEITASYGDQLWFICRCGWWGCQHRHLQHL